MEIERKKILVVDDDPRISELIAEFCEGLGFHVQTVNDSRSAAPVARSFAPDLITLDLEMPGLDGFDVLTDLQTHPTTREIPVLIVSVLAKDVPAQTPGVRAVFEKPINWQALLARVSSLLSTTSAA